jgi:hypothetical protein
LAKAKAYTFAAILAGALVFYFGEAAGLGYDETFLILAFIEFAGSAVAWGMNRGGSTAKK